MSDRDQRVCFVGDSYVAGTGDSSGLGWVGRVTAAAFAGGLAPTVYNLGLRRDTSVQVGERFTREVAPRLEPATDARVVLSFGVNDTTLEDGVQRVGMFQSLRALQQIHRERDGARVMVVGPPAVADNAQNERIHELNDLMADVAKILGMPYVQCFAETVSHPVWQQQLGKGDGFHPDAAGYELIASLAADPIVKWLAR